MDSLEAQCLLIRLTEGKMRPPDLWRHDSSGALSCAYEDGECVFTWPPEEVAELAQAWRDSHESGVPEQARLFLDAHQRLEAIAREAGFGPADVTMHHLGRGELRAVWEDEKVVLLVEEIGPGAGRARRCGELAQG